MMQRTYPEGTLASNILGFYNYFSRESAQGVFGIEESYNRLLTGKPITVFLPNDPNLVEALPDIDPGASLILTIDREIQKMLEDTLQRALDWSGGEGGTIIVSDPKTGEILGMASTPFLIQTSTGPTKKPSRGSPPTTGLWVRPTSRVQSSK
jgi:cell division protein FtsI/penicillin-binding protein 2